MRNVLFVLPRLHPNFVPNALRLPEVGIRPHFVVADNTQDFSGLFNLHLWEPSWSLADYRELWRSTRPQLLVVRQHTGWEKWFVREAKLAGIRGITYTQKPFDLSFSPDSIVSELKRGWERARTGYPALAFSPAARITNHRPRIFESYLPLGVEPGTQRGLAVSQQPTRVLMVAKPDHSRKRHDWLLHALSELGIPFALTLVGLPRNSFTPTLDPSRNSEVQREGDRYQLKIRRLIVSLGIQGHVRILEPKPFNEMTKLYQSADVFCLPSSGEPFAISPAEAMAQGVPALVSARSGAATYIEHGKTGLVFKEDDYGDFKVQLARLLSVPMLEPGIGAQAQRYAERCLNPHLFAVGLGRILDRRVTPLQVMRRRRYQASPVDTTTRR